MYQVEVRVTILVNRSRFSMARSHAVQTREQPACDLARTQNKKTESSGRAERPPGPILSRRYAQSLPFQRRVSGHQPFRLNNREREDEDRNPLMHQRERDRNLVQEGQDTKRRL